MPEEKEASVNTKDSSNYQNNQESVAAGTANESDYESQSERSKSLFPSSLRKRITMVCMVCTDFTAGVLFSVISPFFPVVAEKKGLSPTSIGVVFSVFGVFMIIMAPIWGKLMGKTGAKFTYTTGIAVSAICVMLFGVLYYGPNGSSFLAMCLVTRTIEGSGVVAYLTASYTISASTFPDHVSTMFGLLEASRRIGFMTGPVLGGIVYQAAGYVATLAAAGCLLLLLGIVGAVAVRPDGIKDEGKTGSILPLLLSIRGLLLLLVLCVMAISVAFFTSTLALHLQKFHLTPVQVGAVFLANPGAYGISTPLWGILADKFREYRQTFILVSVIVAAITFFFIGPAPFLRLIPDNLLWLVPLCLLVHGLFISALVIVFPELNKVAHSLGMADDVNTQGLVSGLFTSGTSVGSFIGPILGGGLYDAVGFPWAAAIMGFIMLATALLLIIQMMISRARKRKLQLDEEAECLLPGQPKK